MLVGVQTCTVVLDITMVISRKIRKQPTSRFSNTTFVYIPKECSIVSQGHVFNYVHGSIVCHSQKLNTTKYPSTKVLGKENVVRLHKEYSTAEKKIMTS